jgi:hypothetical protein
MKRRDIKTMSMQEFLKEERRAWNWTAFWVGFVIGAPALVSIIVGIAERW